MKRTAFFNVVLNSFISKNCTVRFFELVRSGQTLASSSDFSGQTLIQLDQYK